MTVQEAIQSRRTIRKFTQQQVKHKDLIELINAARVAPYGANLQPLKFAIVTDETKRKALFPMIKYAGYLSDWNPTFEECPTAFIVVANDTSLKPTEKSECDSGAAVMSMCLLAEDLGLSTVWLGAIDRAAIKSTLNLDEKLDITYLLGVGYGNQSGDIYDIDNDIKYYFDENGDVHVPKRTMDEILIEL